MRQVGFGVESTYGTAATITRFYEFLSWNVKKNHNFKDIATLRNYSRLGAIYSGYVAEGNATIAANYNGIGLLFKNLLGNASTATATAEPMGTHTFPGTAGILTTDRIGLGLTAEAALESDLVWTYSGMKIESMKLSMKLDEIATIDLGLVAKTAATSTSPTSATYGTFEPFIPSDCYITVGGTELPCTSIEVEWKNPVDRPRIMRAQGLGREPRRSANLEYTVTANVFFEAFTGWYASLDGTTEVALVVTAQKSASRSLVITTAKAIIEGEEPVAQGWDRLTVPVTLKGNFNTTATENASVVLKNGDTAA
jgi:hypothetical protein